MSLLLFFHFCFHLLLLRVVCFVPTSWQFNFDRCRDTDILCVQFFKGFLIPVDGFWNRTSTTFHRFLPNPFQFIIRQPLNRSIVRVVMQTKMTPVCSEILMMLQRNDRSLHVLNAGSGSFAGSYVFQP
jgi:hypothetical protein